MAEGKGDPDINPAISDNEDSDDEVSLLVVDEDELQTALETAGISIKVGIRCLLLLQVGDRADDDHHHSGRAVLLPSGKKSHYLLVEFPLLLPLYRPVFWLSRAQRNGSVHV